MISNKQLWLLRIFALIILVVLFGKFLEGTAFDLVIFISAMAIIVWFENRQ